MRLSSDKSFIATFSTEGVIRLWSPDFQSLKSEVKTTSRITSADISYDGNQIAVFSEMAGTVAVLDLETSSYDIVMRSHLGQVIDVCSNRMTNKLITISDDYSVKIWDSDTLE